MAFLTKVRGAGKKAFDRISNDKVRHNLLQAIPFWIASLITGLVAVLYTRLFALAEKGTALFFDCLVDSSPVGSLCQGQRYSPGDGSHRAGHSQIQ